MEEIGLIMGSTLLKRALYGLLVNLFELIMTLKSFSFSCPKLFIFAGGHLLFCKFTFFKLFHRPSLLAVLIVDLN